MLETGGLKPYISFMDKDLRSFREEYKLGSLDEGSLPADPLLLFSHWLDEAIEGGLPEPNAMTLATVRPDGRPAARVVLLKELDGGCFVFYTNYHSAKGQELLHRPDAALVFLWLGHQRQVRVNGRVEKMDAAISDAYFALRPPESQAGALVSAQSQVIAGREMLEKAYRGLLAIKDNIPFRRPEHWGGYALKPDTMEFWQGRESRLHDRILYTLDVGGWKISRLAP